MEQLAGEDITALVALGMGFRQGRAVLICGAGTAWVSWKCSEMGM